MSLTGLLKSDCDAGKLIKDIISIIKIDINFISKDIKSSEIKAPYILNNHKLASQLGTAFDYLARFTLKHHQKKVNGIAHYEDYYVAKYGLIILLENTQIENNNYNSVYELGIEIINKYIDGDDSDETINRLLGVSVYFAKLESIFRNGYSIEKEKSLKQKIDKQVEIELKNQIRLFIDAFENKFNIKTKPCTIYYNPSFGKCSVAVRGADADIIINNTLIDFKSSKYTNNIADDYKQLVGYYLFHKVINHPYEIKKICLYFSRYAKFVEYEFTDKDMENIIKSKKSMEYFINNLIV